MRFLTAQIMRLCGIKAVAINGSLSAKKRDGIIHQFKTDFTVDVLIMSPVGQQGLNLTAASVIFLLVSGSNFAQT